MFRKAINILAAFSLAATALVAGGGSALADSYPKVTQIVGSTSDHVCARYENGSVHCWGPGPYGETDVPSDLAPSKYIAVSEHNSCSVSVLGYIKCWGRNLYGDLSVPDDFGKVTQISITDRNGCAITEEGTVKCWGANRYGVKDAPSNLAQPNADNPIIQVSVSFSESCALTLGGQVFCWGGDSQYWHVSVPETLTSINAISAGDQVVCAISNSGKLQCFGDSSWSGTFTPPDLGKVSSVHVSQLSNRICAIKYSGELACWSLDNLPETLTFFTRPITIPETFPKVTQVETESSLCGINIEGYVRCFSQGSVQSSWFAGFNGPVLVSIKPTTDVYSFTDNGEVFTTWNVGLDPWQAQTQYSVTASPGNQTYDCSNVYGVDEFGNPNHFSSVYCDVTGLINGQDYTFTMTATNSAGSVTSDPSPVFTPRPRWNQIGTPAITGNVVLGGTLTADTGTWDPVPSFNYQWLRNGNPIAGANGQNYTLSFDDLGADISVTVTSTFPMLETKVYTTDSVHLDLASGAVVIPNSPCAGAAIDSSVWMGGIKQPAFTGQAVYGQTLNGTAGSWPAKTKLCSFWYSNGQAIPGAFSKTLKLSGTAFGRQVQYVVVGTDSKGVSVMRYTNAITISNTTFTKATAPAIKGTMKVGSVLQSSVKAWDTGVTYAYQWLRGGQPIDGATAATYTLTGNDLNAKISVQVCGTKPFFNDLTLVSASGTAVVAGVFSPAPKVLLQGSSTKIGSSFVASVSSYPNDADVAIQWLRDGAPITGQTGSTYTVVQADKGHSINVSVTISKLGYVTFSKSGTAKKIS